MVSHSHYTLCYRRSVVKWCDCAANVTQSSKFGGIEVLLGEMPLLRVVRFIVLLLTSVVDQKLRYNASSQIVSSAKWLVMHLIRR